VLFLAGMLALAQRAKASLESAASLSRIRAVDKSVFYNQEPDAGTVPAPCLHVLLEISPSQPRSGGIKVVKTGI